MLGRALPGSHWDVRHGIAAAKKKWGFVSQAKKLHGQA